VFKRPTGLDFVGVLMDPNTWMLEWVFWTTSDLELDKSGCEVN